MKSDVGERQSTSRLFKALCGVLETVLSARAIVMIYASTYPLSKRSQSPDLRGNVLPQMLLSCCLPTSQVKT